MYWKKERLKTSLKTGFTQISLAAQKIWVAHNFGEAAAPLAPPGPYAYVYAFISPLKCSVSTKNATKMFR